MRSQFILMAALCALTPAAFAQEGAAPAAPATKGTPPESKNGKISYAIGLQIGTGLKRDGIEIETKELFSGIEDVFAGGGLRMTEEQIIQVMTAFQQEMQVKMQAEQAKMQAEAAQSGEKNKTEGKAFLEANGKKDGVVTTESGLQYQVLTKGDGPKPALSDSISAHYHGTLTDGTVFDSSIERGTPAQFPVQGVIPGWTEALQLMPVGSKWRLFVPAELAYGENPRPGGPIGPNATLIFDVELLSIDK